MTEPTKINGPTSASPEEPVCAATVSSGFVTHGNNLVYALWILGICGAVMFALGGLKLIPIANRDFASIWLAGKMAANGHAADVYDLQSLRAAGAVYAGTTYKIAFAYPAHFLLVSVPLSFLPLSVAFFAWQALSGILFYLAARQHLPSGMPRLLAVLTPSALVNVTYGQNGLFLGALWLFAFSGSALSAALLTLKPHIGFLVAVEMLRRKLAIRATLIVIAIVVLTALLFGWGVWHANLSIAANSQFAMINSGAYPNWLVQMTTPLIGYGYAGWAFFGLASALLLMRSFNVFTAATATFLMSPYGFHYDMTVVCLGFGVRLFRCWRSMPPWQTVICGLAFLSPLIVRAGTWLIPPLLLAGLFVLTEKE